MDKVASLTGQERSDIFRYTADQMNLASPIIEKDFWVCWTLKHLFGHPTLGSDLIFKGGTTLSKVYNVIQRFSEDIDISISRSLLGFDGERDPGNPELSVKKRRKLLEDMGKACSEYVCGRMKDDIETLFTEIIGKPGESWSVQVYDEDPDRQTLLFNYPSSEDRLDYIKPYVRIECGCRSDFWPIEKAVITPYLVDHVPQAFENADCGVTVLSAGRTFWEKATILHQEHHRPEDKNLPDRYSRHYYDLAKTLGTHP
ncbi:nucleotidyl transferase AbiEii/AbiGii toxin family protein [Verrucomicrobiota bacterium]